MDVREKLVELVDKARRYAANKCHSFMSCAECDHYGEHDGNCRNTYIAESLIADGVTVQEWISVKDRLPEEHDCFFTSFYGTEKWQDGMFLKCSNTVLASVEYEDGKIRVKAIITKDGKWDLSKLYRASKVTHWMPLPQPPKGE